MHSDSEDSPIKKKNVKRRDLVTSSSSDDDSDVPVMKRKFRPRVTSSSSDDDSDVPVMKRKSRPRVSSSSDSDGSSIGGRKSKKLRVLSESDLETSCSSYSDLEVNEIFERGHQGPQALVLTPRTGGRRRQESESSGSFAGFECKKPSGENETSSDCDEGEKCIICFKAFRGVIAHPSGCQHPFHSECLLTWSKTSNTCPIDRIKYTQVFETTSNGDIVRRHNVSSPSPDINLNNYIEPDDPTFCEVCSQHDREHEMLLCDQCESGYHLNCLDPPLTEVPVGDWFCPECAALNNVVIPHDELNDLLREGGIVGNRLRARQRRLNLPPAVGPRTRAVQRVINSIRQMTEQNNLFQRPSSSRTHQRQYRRSTQSRSGRRSTHYKVELVTVEDGSTIEVKVAVNTRKRRTKKRKSNTSRRRGRTSSSKRTSKKHVATNTSRSAVSEHSSQQLDIFGSRPQLEYFSGCEAEDELDEEGGLSMLRARTAGGVRGMVNRKQIAAQILRSAPRRPLPRISYSSAPPDLLSSILDEQTKWHSPNAVIQSNSNGEVKVIIPGKSSNLPVRKSAGNGEGAAGTSSSGEKSTPQRESQSQRNGESSTSSTCVPPLQPPPQPVFSRIYEDDDFDLYADIEPPYVNTQKSFNKYKKL